MASLNDTNEQIIKYKASTQSPRDPYEKGKNHRVSRKYLPDEEAQNMPAADWQNYIDGRMGREKRKPKEWYQFWK